MIADRCDPWAAGYCVFILEVSLPKVATLERPVGPEDEADAPWSLPDATSQLQAGCH